VRDALGLIPKALGVGWVKFIARRSGYVVVRLVIKVAFGPYVTAVATLLDYLHNEGTTYGVRTKCRPHFACW